MTEFKNGDRVRIIIETDLREIGSDHYETTDNYFTAQRIVEHGGSFHIEKVAPVFVDGDVIRHKGADNVYHLIDGRWLHSSGVALGELPETWEENLEIIYKTDAAA